MSLEGTLGLEKGSCFRGTQDLQQVPRPDIGWAVVFLQKPSPLLPSSLLQALPALLPALENSTHALLWPPM